MEVIKGKVIKGENIGEKQGYPTANLPKRVLAGKKLSKGVYIAKARLAGRWRKALLIIGAPGIKKQKKGKVEVYFLDYKAKLYGKRLVVKAYKKIREIRKYNKHKDLIKRIRQDIQQARHYFKKN